MRKIEKVLALGSHPDDIEIGCGGTIAKWADNKVKVYFMIMTVGESGGKPDERKAEQEDAAKRLGVKRVYWGDYLDTQLPINNLLISDIESVVGEVKPDLVFVHHYNDTHQDHRALSMSAITATRYTKNVLFYEGPSTYDFSPTIFVDISDYIDRKFEALFSHTSQINKTNIEGLNITQITDANAIFRGVEGRVKYAEAYIPFRVFI
ncbi:MAG: PIG-L family deacetylase [Deltaproteobacteria bacterium]|nr:PIG-L family deacetylase [Deltaproteobacteria bacterium]